ncbi:MAG TPA: XopAJ/AvrRxo1 family type III secretion system effector zeta toxin [Noviherbaspirillum sp.]|uniref:XopAJ/AvrRxo1 family type III secretion system effector zeta toxin n=1 Tax=Noviherbaspirillum sp. TaxID=1926288 RepID=UPI002DDDB0C2|nr:XopAJ/AvrRxo1 family type III secretion system effector zeta toxin [Noviherbaspirillum sp.]HEV2608626.1 XopAJ/AvrRxo1 family type III secretion system effector zeta toxin [Noviherbaspirillum sp.]
MKLPLNTAISAARAITAGVLHSRPVVRTLERAEARASSGHVILNEQGARQRILDVVRGRTGHIPDTGQKEGRTANARRFSTLHTNTPDEATDAQTHDRTATPESPFRRPTSDALYAIGPLPEARNARWDYLHHPENWVPERRRLQETLLADAVRNALSFAEAVVDSGRPPAVFALRGNTAAGKTSTVKKTMPMLADALEKCANGAVNPDMFKPRLRAQGGVRLSMSAVHTESCVLADRLMEKLIPLKTVDGSPASILIDKRLAEKESVAKYVSLATTTDRQVLLSDIDAPLEKSLARVLARSPSGDHPVPPFSAVSEGFTNVRTNRAAVVDLFVKRPELAQYQLIGTARTGEHVKVAAVEHGDLTIEHGDLYSELIKPPADVPERMARERIDERTIDALTRDLEPEHAEHLRAALSRYLGHTWAQALDAHSEKT